jgi:ABC-2 type transport system ATP-binding protein
MEYLEYVEMTDRLHSQVKTLSGGLKRRLMIARALTHGPSLLFLDEPTVGLDPAIRRRIWSLIKKINQSGVTIFLTTHYIEEAEFLADRVAFIHQGHLLECDSPQTIMERLGQWAVDHFYDSEMETHFFSDRTEAANYIQKLDQGGTLRRINLEDAFLSITGKRVL